MKSKILIRAEVTAWVTHDENNDITGRDVDIYLHGAGEGGYLNKSDLGTDKVEIDVIDVEMPRKWQNYNLGVAGITEADMDMIDERLQDFVDLLKSETGICINYETEGGDKL